MIRKLKFSQKDIAYANEQLHLNNPSQSDLLVFLKRGAPGILSHYNELLKKAAIIEQHQTSTESHYYMELMGQIIVTCCSVMLSSNNHCISFPLNATKIKGPINLETLSGICNAEIRRLMDALFAKIEPSYFKNMFCTELESTLLHLTPIQRCYVLTIILFIADTISKEAVTHRAPGGYNRIIAINKKNVRALPERTEGNQRKEKPDSDGKNPEEDIKPLVLSEKVSFDDIGGQKDAVREIKRIFALLKNETARKRWGAKIPRGICLHGPPGNGKTLTAQAVACSAELPFYSVCITDVMEKWVGSSPRNMKKYFDAVKKTGGILFIDEADNMGTSRGTEDTSGVKREVISVITTALNGIDSNSNYMVIIATNKPEDMDSAILRTGRIDLFLDIKAPNEEGRLEILDIHMNKTIKKAAEAGNSHVFEANFNRQKIAHLTEGFSGSDIANLIERLTFMKASEEDLSGNYQGPITTGEAEEFVLKIKRDKYTKTKDKVIVPFGS